VTGYGLDDWTIEVRIPAGLEVFLFDTVFNQPLIQCVLAALSLGVKRPEREADHSPSTSAEFKECVDLYLHAPNMSSCGGA
jgi:hypothetical protein